MRHIALFQADQGQYSVLGREKQRRRALIQALDYKSLDCLVHAQEAAPFPSRRKGAHAIALTAGVHGPGRGGVTSGAVSALRAARKRERIAGGSRQKGSGALRTQVPTQFHIGPCTEYMEENIVNRDESVMYPLLTNARCAQAYFQQSCDA